MSNPETAKAKRITFFEVTIGIVFYSTITPYMSAIPTDVMQYIPFVGGLILGVSLTLLMFFFLSAMGEDLPNCK